MDRLAIALLILASVGASFWAWWTSTPPEAEPYLVRRALHPEAYGDIPAVPKQARGGQKIIDGLEEALAHSRNETTDATERRFRIGPR